MHNKDVYLQNEHCTSKEINLQRNPWVFQLATGALNGMCFTLL